eukprot:GEMP01014750.1.p1 GENE.GEMP01014750.1~~GEMP01014750.1.p1  ORF type:complete len:755 (+),score=102.35 GEMP01014750.1:116-2380(+)
MQTKTMFTFCFILGVVNTTNDPTANCENWPDAAGCEGEVVWNSIRGHCECGPPPQSRDQTSNHRVLQQLSKGETRYYFDKCYPGQQRGKLKIMKIGILVDRGFYEAAGNNDDRVKRIIYALVNYANALYEEQISIRMRVGTLHMAKPGHSIPSRGNTGAFMNDVPDSQNNDCAHIVDQPGKGATDFFNAWVKQNSNDYALWHLFTACSGAGAGAAFGDSLCVEGRIAFTNWRPWTRHLTFSHETGHNFDAQHTFARLGHEEGSHKGIMDYGTNEWKGIVQFHSGHQKYMCARIRKSMNPKTQNLKNNCWADVGDAGGCPSSCPASLHGNGECNAECNVEACAFDFGDCDCPADVDQRLLGNKICDPEMNNEHCKYDNGDCLGNFCADKTYYGEPWRHQNADSSCKNIKNKQKDCNDSVGGPVSGSLASTKNDACCICGGGARRCSDNSDCKNGESCRSGLCDNADGASDHGAVAFKFELPAGARITKVEVWGDQSVVGFQFFTLSSGAVKSSPVYGKSNNGMPIQTLEMESTEYISQVDTRAGGKLDYIRFVTNSGPSVAVGNSKGGHPYNYQGNGAKLSSVAGIIYNNAITGVRAFFGGVDGMWPTRPATTTLVPPTPSTSSPAPSTIPTTVAPTHDPNTSTKDGKGGSDSAVTTGIVLSVLIVAAAIIIILGVCWKRKGDESNDVKPRIPADQSAKRTSLKRAQGRKPKKKPKSLKYQKDRLKPKEASPHDQNQDKKQESKSRKSKRDALRE